LPAFLDEVLDPFYAPAAKAKESYSFGQLFRCSAYYPHQNLSVWRPRLFDPKLGTARDFNIQSSVGDSFRRTLPYTDPVLETNEEFIAIKAKPRPVILLQPPDPSLVAIKKGTYPAKIVRHLCPVVLVYSAVNEVGDSKFPPEFVERIRRLEYRQFMFLPKGGAITVDSIARLDEIQSVSENQLDPTEYALSDAVCKVLRSQVGYFYSGLSEDEFVEWAALLK
jgi:hypothetical protein